MSLINNSLSGNAKNIETKMKRALINWLFCFPICFGLISCSKDHVDITGNILGSVSDSRTGEPLAGVSLSLSPSGKTYTTGMDGRYEFRDIEAQEYSIQADKSGYQADKKTAFVKVGEDSRIDFQLLPSIGILSVSQSNIDFGSEATTLTFDIINNGNAALTWQLSENVEWLSCTPTAGKTQMREKSSVVVNVDRMGLERGVYSQTIAVSSDGGSAVINVSMSVQGINVNVSPEELDFGSTASSLQLTLINAGSGSISYILTPSNEWIKLNRKTGVFTQTESITVSVDRSTFSEGDYSGGLTLTVGGNELVIPVRMNIPPKAKPTVSLQAIENITFNSASFKGAVVDVGSAKVTRYGFCWGTMEKPDITSSGICNLGDCSEAKGYIYNVSSLEPSTTYYVCAYAENAEGIAYSNQMKIQTKGTPQLPEVETGSVSDIQSFQAMVAGNITFLGNTDGLSQYGHVWSTRGEPTIADNKTQLGVTGSTGAFNSTLTNLEPNTTYHVRAYAVNSIGTSYGQEVTFTTLLAAIVLTTGTVDNITHNSARCSGSIASTGGHIIVECGVCWGTSTSPTINDNTMAANASANPFTVNLTGLTENTVYHVRAYAKSGNGQVFYGDDMAFSTSAKGVDVVKTGYGEDEKW